MIGHEFVLLVKFADLCGGEPMRGSNFVGLEFEVGKVDVELDVIIIPKDLLFVGAARIKGLELSWFDMETEFFGDFRDGTLQAGFAVLGMTAGGSVKAVALLGAALDEKLAATVLNENQDNINVAMRRNRIANDEGFASELTVLVVEVAEFGHNYCTFLIAAAIVLTMSWCESFSGFLKRASGSFASAKIRSTSASRSTRFL